MILVLAALLGQCTILPTRGSLFSIVTVHCRCDRCTLELLLCLMFIDERKDIL